MANKVHIVPHFHWDREWYFTAEESKILLVHDMEEILERLEQDKNYPCFVMDGQTSVLEDYFSVAPQNRERVKKLVREGRLKIGPWYTQIDEMVVGGESILRNLLYGLRDCREFGPAMMIGYLPDSFGQCARMPQILNGFGITRSMFWRGTSQRMGTNKTEFWWNDEDGSRVVVQLLPLGYAIGKYLPTELSSLKVRMDKYMPVLERGASTDHILIPNGHDQMPIQKDIYDVMDTMKDLYPEKDFFLSSYEQVYDEIEKNENLDTLTGEFLDGRYMRVHRSIYSSRADLKIANTRIEHKITHILEPLASVAYGLGFPYHHGLIEVIWKEIMKNHAHDSMGCCCSDKVHRAIQDRYFLAEERTDRLIEYYERQIADAMRCDEALDKLVVYNLLPYERTQVIRAEIITKMKSFDLKIPCGDTTPYRILSAEIIDAGLIDRQIVHYGDYEPFVKYTVEFLATVPSFGFETYLIQESQNEPSGNKPFPKEDHRMENEYLAVDICPNGTLNILDKKTGQTYHRVLLIEDSSDDGDGYDYSPLPDDYVVTSDEITASISCTHCGYSQKAYIEFEMKVPANLASRKANALDGYMKIQTTLELKQHSEVLDICIQIDNQAEDHRVRALVPNRLASSFSISDNPFGEIYRPVRDDAMDVWQEQKWSERPDSIYPFLTYVTTDAADSLAVITDSVREYEIIGTQYDIIAITLFRSVGVLGKENLVRRPGRPSGIKMDTPDSQMPGMHCYTFGIAGKCSRLPLLAREYVTPLISYNKMPYNAMKLNPSEFQTPYRFSLLKEQHGEAVLSVLKKAEDEDALILRFYQGHHDDAHISLYKDGAILYVKQVCLDESDQGELCKADSLPIKKNQILTVKLLP